MVAVKDGSPSPSGGRQPPEGVAGARSGGLRPPLRGPWSPHPPPSFSGRAARNALFFPPVGRKIQDLALPRGAPRRASPGALLMAGKYLTRHGAMRFLGEFTAAEDAAYLRGDRVVVRTERGLELGEVLCEASERAVQLIAEPTGGQVVRRMTEQDHAEVVRLREAEAREFDTCNRFIAARKLQME